MKSAVTIYLSMIALQSQTRSMPRTSFDIGLIRIISSSLITSKNLNMLGDPSLPEIT